MESYAAIEAIHLEVHRLGNELIDLKHAGDTQLLATRLGEVHAASEHLIEMIQVLWQGDQVELAVELALDVLMLREEWGNKNPARWPGC